MDLTEVTEEVEDVLDVIKSSCIQDYKETNIINSHYLSLEIINILFINFITRENLDQTLDEDKNKIIEKSNLFVSSFSKLSHKMFFI